MRKWSVSMTWKSGRWDAKYHFWTGEAEGPGEAIKAALAANTELEPSGFVDAIARRID